MWQCSRGGTLPRPNNVDAMSHPSTMAIHRLDVNAIVLALAWMSEPVAHLRGDASRPAPVRLLCVWNRLVSGASNHVTR